MKAINKLFGIVFAMLSMAWTARGVEPVAVWNGDLGEEKAGFSFALNGNTLNADGTITMSAISDTAKLGVTLRSTTAAYSASTIIFEVEGMTIPSADGAAIVSTYSNQSGYDDYCGIRVTNSGETYGIWNNNKWGNTSNCQTHRVNSAAELGVATRVALVYVQNKSKGTQGYMMINGTLTKIFGATGLVSTTDGMGAKGWNILGAGCDTTANRPITKMAGAKLKNVAIFNSELSTSDIADYEFPDPGVEYETLTYDGFLTTTFVDTGWTLDLNKLEECVITGTMSGSSIANKPAPSNGYWAEVPDESGVAKFQMQVYQYNSASDHWLKAVEVELKQGDNGTVLIRGVRAGYMDGGATDPKGSLKITDWNSTLATSATTQAYGVNKVVIKVPAAKETYTGKVISVNVTQGSTGYINADQTTPLGTFPANAWTQQSSEARGAGNAQKIDFSTVAEYNVNTAAKTDVSAKVFGIAMDAGNFGRRDVAGDIAPATGYDYLYCWLSMKDGTQGTTYLNAEVPYETYDVYLYFSAHKVAQKSGGAAPAIRSFVIGGTHSSIDAEPTGGTRYTVDASGALVVSSDANATWGDGSIADIQVGKNYVVLENQSGAFSLLMNGSSGGLAAVQFAERTSGKKKVEVDCGTEYSMSDANAVEGDAITLKFADAGGTLLIDEAPSRKYTIKCAGKMEILGDDYTMTQTDFNKLTLTQVAGSLTIDAKGGLEMTDAIKSAIKAATSNKTYTFIGEGNKGVALDYGDNNDGTQLKTHIVFDGGAHTMKYRCESAGLKFGANATADNPTIRVTNNATLTFAARNLCGWTSGNSNADGIIRVDNGSKLYLNPTGGTLYWAQQFYLEPGAQLTYSDGASFRINGGTNYAPQIFVPASTVDMTDTPAKIIRSGNNDFCVNGQGTKGMAISVGANSKLVIESGIALDNANCDVVKLGGGVLEVTGNIVNQNFIVNDGSVSLLGSITKLTFGENGALDISEGTPTITGSLVTATEKQLELTVDSPVHMMPVITLPAGADKKGWTAIVNGKSTVNDLIAEGNTLKLKWKIPPTIELDEDSIVIEPASDWNGGKVMVDISTLNRGDYTGEDDIKYILRFGDKTVFGEEKDDKANFELDPAEFTAGNIYRGEFVVGYGEDGDEVPGAEVTLYMGEKGYKEAVDWVNETVDTFKTTGSYDPDEGAKIEDDKLAFNSAGDVVFTPNEHADYVERCDSVFTFEILAEEAIDDDDSSIEDDVQAGVKLVANNKGGVKFQFISGDEWIDGPDASLNTMYEVKVSFHYAKEDGDSDTVTYEVKDLTQGALVVERREGTDEKASEIVFSDGTKLGYLKGTLQVEAATPKERGMEPGGKEMPLKADNQKDADEEAKKIPVLVPNDENVVAALDTDAKKDVYKALFKVVAVKKDGAYVAQVVFTDTAISTIKEDEKNILSEVMEKLGSLLGEEGELDDIKGQPGLYYGIGSDGELVNMGEAQPEEWKIADKDGNIIGLKVKKAANAKRGFYKVLCSPVKSSSK